MKTKVTSIVSSLVLGLGLVILLLVLLTLLPALHLAGAAGSTGTIIGRVYDSGGTPITTTVDVWAEPYDGGPGGNGTQADASGYYTITGLATNDYRVVARKFGYATEYYSDTFDYGGATRVSVTDTFTTPNIDFFLDPGGNITGTVKDASSSTPITNAQVSASPANGDPWSVGADQIDSTGAYTIYGAPVGQYKVSAQAAGYLNEFYNDKTDWASADVVTVTTGQVVGSINLTLEQPGVITGRVTDADTGLPITNANINADPADGSPGGVGTSAIDSSGVYTINNVPAGQYKVQAQATGYQQEFYQEQTDWNFADVVTVTAGQIVGNVDFTLQASGAISGFVYDSGGVPLSNMAVDVEFGGYGTCTAGDGGFTLTGLPFGSYKVWASGGQWCGGNPNYIREYWQNVSSVAAATPITLSAIITQVTGITFTLDAGGAITGTVTETGTGSPIANLQVDAEDYDTSVWGGGAQTDAAGVYTITGLPSGDYRVSTCSNCTGLSYGDEFYNNTHDWSLATRVTVTAPNTTGGIDFALSQAGYIKGRVYDSGGTPITTGADVWADPYNGGSGGNGAQSDASGYYTITVAAGDYRVSAQKFGYGTEYYNNTLDWSAAASVHVAEGATVSGIDFYLDAGGVITGTVMDASGTVPITDAQVNAGPANGGPWGGSTNQIDSTGVYTLAGLPPGQYKVEAWADGYDTEFYKDKTDWAFADVVTVTAGQVTGPITFTLQQEQGGEVFGQVVLPNGDPVASAWVDAESFDHMHHKGDDTDAGGNFRIGGLSPGTWELWANPPAGYSDYSQSEEVTLQISATSSITLSAPLTLTMVNVKGRAVYPDGSGAAWAGVDVYSTDFSVFKSAGADYDGTFRIGGLTPGNYKVELHVPWGTSGVVPPDPVSFSITSSNIIQDLGNITFTQASKHIVGVVVRANSAGVPNVEVNANRRGMSGWAWTQTDGSGNFSLDVAPGDWEVMIHPAPGASVDWVFNGLPKLVSFANDTVSETKQITFTVTTADAQVIGKVEGPNGETVQPWAVWVDVRNMSGQGNGAPLSADGRFTVPVAAGTYHAWVGVDEQTYPSWSSPRIAPFNVISGATYDLGTIRLVGKTSAIAGRVTRASDGTGLSGVWVHSWQHEGGWASTTTDSNGNYSLSVVSGTWEVDVEPPYTSTYITGQPPQRVQVGDNETVTGIDFALVEAAGTIQGTLYDPQGNLLNDVDGWAYARQGNSPEPVAGAPVNNGQFTINVPSGSYYVGLWLPPNSGYTVSGEQQVGVSSQAVTEMVARAETRAEVAVANMSINEQQTMIQAGTTVTVAFTLLPNDARIVGGFFTDSGHTTPATGLMGEVFGMQGMGGAWQSTSIDPTDGSFELQVAAGDWNLGYWLMSSGYVNSPPPDTRVTIAAGEVFTFNFTVVVANATIEGVIKEPNGTPLNYAWAWAHRDRIETGPDASAAIDTGDDSEPPNGYFNISVPSGGQYEVGAHAPENWGYIQPDFQVVTPTAGTPVSVTLQFKQSNGTITGTVYYHDNAGNSYYGPWAWVWAWSDDGQHTGAPTDHEGKYQLNVVTGTTWHVGAAYQAEGGSLFYETTSPTDIVMNTPQASADLHLYLASTALPPAVADTFDPSIGWTGTLSDGTRIEIPAGAMPTTDTVRISVTPLIEELHNTLTARPFGFGYAIAAYEDSTGNQIIQNFNANVLITFYYTDDELQRRGVSEDDLSPAYFSTTTNSWTKVESYSVDKTANQVTVQINHFSTWSLTSPGGGGGTNNTYLPIILKDG